ncbi:ankyrin repeat domain-containing protein [Acinetobacter baumannii]|nr:ankyrin repeat domain-containing protein [Acinetobacter baumannii]
MARKQSEKKYLNIELQIIFGCLFGSMDIMRKFFIFGVPVKINSFSPIPEDDEELSLPELIYWASLGDLEQVKQLLIDREDPNQTDDEGYTALQAAAENDHLEIVKLLVEKGAHVTYKSEYTALQLAEMAGNTDIVNYLKSL